MKEQQLNDIMVMLRDIKDTLNIHQDKLEELDKRTSKLDVQP